MRDIRFCHDQLCIVSGISLFRQWEGSIAVMTSFKSRVTIGIPPICHILRCRFKIHTSDSIVNKNNEDITLFMLSNLWNVLNWKSLFKWVFHMGVPCSNWFTNVMSSHRHGDILTGEDRVDLKLVTWRIRLLQIRYELQALIVPNYRGKMEIDRGLAPEATPPCTRGRGQTRLLAPNRHHWCVMAWPTMAPCAKPWTTPTAASCHTITMPL